MNNLHTSRIGENRIGGVMVSVLVSSAIDHGLIPGRVR
jgi:hypothetical protein